WSLLHLRANLRFLSDKRVQRHAASDQIAWRAKGNFLWPNLVQPARCANWFISENENARTIERRASYLVIASRNMVAVNRWTPILPIQPRRKSDTSTNFRERSPQRFRMRTASSSLK